MMTDWFGDGFAFLDKGGVVIWILFALSIIAAAIVLLKTWQFWRLHPRRLGFVETALNNLSGGKRREALNQLSAIGHPVARVMESAIATAGDPSLSPRDRDAEIDRIGSGEIRRIESHLGSLEIIANLSPLLGLLGTVIGMIAAFSELEQAGTNVDPTVLAGGIWTALLTTAYGLAIAIPALGAFYLFESTVAGVRGAMQNAAVAVNSILKPNGGKPGKGADA